MRELTYGVARLRGRLDFLLASHVHRRLETLEPVVLDLLRAGAYQILYMGGVPTYAAVSSTVELSRRIGPRPAVGLINAVLRSLARSGVPDDAFPDPDVDPEGYLTHWHSHPRWLVRRWLERWTVEEVVKLAEHDNGLPALFFRPVGTSPREAMDRLGNVGITTREVGCGSRCLRIEERVDPRRALDAVPGIIQDPGAALVVQYVEPRPGSLIADLCAAPGGKALALSESAAYVVAADKSIPRLKLVSESVRRLGVPVGVVAAAAQAPPMREADVVLLDVPCSGTGTLARHPDAKWRLEGGDIGRLAEVQSRILGGASRLVPSGGLLVYSTCSLEPEENEVQVERFLNEHRQFVPERPQGLESRLLDEQGFLRVLPQRTGFDGAFAARLRRVE